MGLSAAALAAMSTAGSAGLGVLGQVSANRTNRQIAEETNELQRWLAENANKQELAMWNLMNDYNHPTQQMQRLKDAGLNPNLIYGNSAGGASGIAGSKPNIHVPQMQRAQVKNTMDSIGKLNFMNMLSSYQNIEKNRALTDNYKKDWDIKNQKLINEGLQEAYYRVRNNKSELAYKIAKTLEETQVEVAKQNLENIKKKNEALGYENEISSELKGMNLTPQDNVIIRILANLGLEPGKFWKVFFEAKQKNRELKYRENQPFLAPPKEGFKLNFNF